MDLLTQADWDEFRANIKNVTDTFFKVDCTLHRTTYTYSNWNSSRADNADENDIIVKCLSIYDKNGVNLSGDFGQIDLTEGYIYFNFEDLKEAGLIDNNDKLLIDSQNDEVTFLSERYKLIGHHLVGPTQEKYALVKLLFKKLQKSR